MQIINAFKTCTCTDRNPQWAAGGYRQVAGELPVGSYSRHPDGMGDFGRSAGSVGCLLHIAIL